MNGILGGIYRALDPILPFDRYLDPRFGVLGGDGRPQEPVGGVLGYGGAQSPQAPQMPPQGQNMAMGFPPMPPGLMAQATAGAPRASGGQPWKPSLMDTIWGVAAGYSPGQARRGLTMQHQEDQLAGQAAEKAAEEDAMARRVFANDERGYLAWRSARAKTGEALATGLEDYTLAPGGVRGRGGETLQRAPFAPLSGGPGTQFRDPSSGALIGEVPYKPEVVSAPTTNNVTVVDPNPTGGRSLGERNNNPGNLEDGEFARSQPGYAGTDGRFARFASPEAGAAAQERLLADSYIGRGQNTIQSIIEGVPGEGGRRVHGYAPRQSDGGDNTDEQVNNYIGYVARRAGVDPTAPIPPDRVPAVAAAMREFETGQRPGGQGGGTRVVQQGVADPSKGGRPATAEEKAAYGVSADTPAAVVDGKFTVLGAAIKANTIDAKDAARRSAAITKAGAVIKGIDDAVGMVGPWTAGFGSLLEGVPTTPARALKAKIDFIKANIGFDALQEMRANSPTGGALGQVAIQELSYLQASLASLDTGLGEAELKAALGAVKQHYTRYMQILKQEQAAEAPAPAAPAAAATRGAPRTGDASGMTDAQIRAALGL